MPAVWIAPMSCGFAASVRKYSVPLCGARICDTATRVPSLLVAV